MFSRNVNKQRLIDNNEAPASGNRIVLGVTLPAVSYQPKEFGASQVITAKAEWLNTKNAMYITSAISKLMYQFWYDRKPGLQIYKDMKIRLPTKNGEMDFAFMETFISDVEHEYIYDLESDHKQELNAYLSVTWFADYALTEEEKRVLWEFESWKVEFEWFTYASIFSKIIQGRRLKKEDQINGDIPFVMAGTTNTWVVNYISNPVASFPKNSITVDIFGNTFYRSYDFGAGDDTGVYWNDQKEYSKEMMLFFASSMSKGLYGKFDFWKKLRSSQSLDFKAQLPTLNNQPHYEFIQTLIFAVQKIVIRDVVLYAERKIEATRQVVEK